MTYQPKTSRDLLIDLGVGRFNATMMIESLMMAPATTEAASPPIQLLVGQIQTVLASMGATNVRDTGLIDDATAHALAQVAGPNFLKLSWFEVCRRVVAAKKSGKRIRSGAGVVIEKKGVGFFDLPDVPGGIITYGLGAYALYRLLKKKRS